VRCTRRTAIARLGMGALVVVGPWVMPTVRAAEPLDVSLLQLIARPEQYNGKRVRVIGFCHLEFEGNGLYVHGEDYERAIYKNGIWLDVGPEKQGFSDEYVLVEGTFDARMKGHLSLFSGSLRAVTRMDRWPSRKDFQELKKGGANSARSQREAVVWQTGRRTCSLLV
jgi:hypothetical protein